MAGKLERLHHPLDTPEIPTTEGKTFLCGRTVQQHLDVILCESDFVSRRHCEVSYKNGSFCVKDLNSLNGTYLNGDRLPANQDTELHFGDFLGLGIPHDTEDVDVKDRSYFIFTFKRHEFEVIDLEDDDANPETADQPEQDASSEASDDIVILDDVVENNNAALPNPPPVVGCSSTNRNIPDALKIALKKEKEEIASTTSKSSNDGGGGERCQCPRAPSPIAHSSNSIRKSKLELNSSAAAAAGSGSAKGQRDAKPAGLSSIPHSVDGKNDSTSRSTSIPHPPGNDENAKKGSNGATMKESSSEDDSSDGLSEACKDLRRPCSPAPPPAKRFKPSEPKNEGGGLTSKASTCKSNSPKPSKSSKRQARKELVVKLRQLIRLEKGSPAIRKSKFYNLSPTNRDRIYKQWKASRKHCAKTDTNGPVASTSFPTMGDKQEKQNSSKKRRPSDAPKTDRSEIHTNIAEPEREKTGKQVEPEPKKRKISGASHSVKQNSFGGEQFHHRGSTDNRRISGDSTGNSSVNEEGFTYSQPYGSPDPALCPISDVDDEVLDCLVDQYSDVSEDIALNRSPDLEAVSDISDTDTCGKDGPPSPPPPPAPEAKIKKQQQPRMAQTIDRPPTPPAVARTKARLAAKNKAKPAQIPKSLAPSSSSSTANIGLTMQEKLKSIAIKDKERKAQEATEQTKNQNLVRAPVKTKLTSTSRNDAFFASMITSSNNAESDKGTELEAQKKQANHSEKPVFNAPCRDTTPRLPPMPSTSVQATMPLNSIGPQITKMFGNCQPPGTASTNDTVKPHIPGQAGSRAVMEKAGVTLARENEEKARVIMDYGHSSRVPIPKVIGGNQNRPEPFIPVIQDDEVYRRMLRWIPAWLQEQKKAKSPPPVAGSNEVFSALPTYEDYKTYVDTFFPLILLDIWSTVTQDASRNDGRSTEFHVAVKKITRVKLCPLLSKERQSRLSRKDDYYTVLDCYAISDDRSVCSLRHDLGIATFGVVSEQGEGEQQCFAFVPYLSQEIKPITPEMANHHNLRESYPLAKYQRSLRIIVHSGVQVNQKRLGKIKTVSYVKPKLRDVEALLHLKNAKLYSHIVKPTRPTENTFNPNLPIPPGQVVQFVEKLNRTQKSAVHYITSKINGANPELLLVHGPPGTGKTKTIVGMVLQMLASCKSALSKKILICTPSNTAIDEIIKRLSRAMEMVTSERMKDVMIVRVGESTDKTAKKYMLDEHLLKLAESSPKLKSIRDSIQRCRKQIASKQEEIKKLQSSNGSKTLIDSLQRGIEKIVSEELLVYEKDLAMAKKEQAKENNSHRRRRELLEKATVICSTLNSCSGSLLTDTFGLQSGKSRPFLCCIVDEASQTTEPETLAPLLLQVEKMILVGDPQQLGATVLSKEAEKKRFGQSLFSRLYNFHTQDQDSNFPNPVIMLTDQYRMHPEILAWPNDYFYQGLLKPRSTMSDGSFPLRPYMFLDLCSQEVASQNGGVSNEEEVNMVIEILKTTHSVLKSKNNQEWSIGVITPYNRQKAAIRNEIKQKLQGVATNIEVDTVDSFQGREKDIVIISCVRTDDTGFLKSGHRLNVALTRARHSLLIIGDASCLKKDSMWKSLIENAEERRMYEKIPRGDSWTNPGYLKKRLFTALSPTKRTD